MKSAAINRQFLMGAVTNSHPAICGSIHQMVPHTEVVQIGELIEIFTNELSLVPNVEATNVYSVLNSHPENVGVWLNNFCQQVLPVLASRFIPQRA